jgi:hypothetical protein
MFFIRKWVHFLTIFVNKKIPMAQILLVKLQTNLSYGVGTMFFCIIHFLTIFVNKKIQLGTYQILLVKLQTNLSYSRDNVFFEIPSLKIYDM